MKNSEKSELRMDIRELNKKNYSKKEAVKVLVDYGYVKSTASRYWDALVVKPEVEEKNGE